MPHHLRHPLSHVHGTLPVVRPLTAAARSPIHAHRVAIARALPELGDPSGGPGDRAARRRFLALALVVLAWRLEQALGARGTAEPLRIEDAVEALSRGPLGGRLGMGTDPHELVGIHLDARALGVIGETLAEVPVPSIDAQPELADLPGLLIEDLLPAAERRRGGEFYTPRWLAERTVALSGWYERAGGILVDPCCGAGAMLVAAIRAQGAQLARNGTPAGEVVSHLVEHVRGADLSPLAVLATRVACLTALAPWLPGKLLRIRADVADALADDAPPREADVVVGNPPWIRWCDVPEGQRERTRRAARDLDLIPRQVWHGGSEVDLSAVLAMASTERLLRDGGRSSLVLPRTHLHAPASFRFRQLALPDGTPLCLEAIEDFEAVPSFRGAAATAAVVVWSRKPAGACAPACARYELRDGWKPDAATPWKEASSRMTRLERTWVASPGDGRWCLVGGETRAAASWMGETEWVRGRKGLTTDLNDAYFVEVVGEGSGPGLVRVRAGGAGRRSRLPSQEFGVERELLWPLLKGAGQIRPFHCAPLTQAVIVPNTGIQQLQSAEDFASRYPAAHAWFHRIETGFDHALSRRSTFRRAFGKGSAPFFAVYNVGEYTFLPFKVVWPEIASQFRAAVSLPCPPGPGLDPLPVVPDHKLYFAAFPQLAPADYLCAFLNAPSVRKTVEAVTARLQIGTLLRQIRVPTFDPALPAHLALCRFGQEARTRGGACDATRLDALVRQVAASTPG